MEDQCQIKIELSILSEQKLDESMLTRIIGKKATIFEQNGSVSSKEKINNVSAWVLATKYIQAFEVEQLLYTFFSELNRADQIGKDLSLLNVKVKIDIVIKDINGAFPSLFIPHEIIAKFQLLNADIDIDVLL